MRYLAIRSEGGLVSYDLLDKIVADQLKGQKPADFGLPKGQRLIDEISRVWADAQNLWSNFKRRRQSLTDRDPYGTSITRSWIVSLLSDPEMLGFNLRLQASGVVVNTVTFAISHRDGDGDDAVPIHIEGCKIDLDRRLHTKLRTSPQAMLQDFLNNAEQASWGILTNGGTLRLLRDSSRTSRPTYLEFDLEGILEGNRFNEFALFYRLCHRSRFPKAGQEPSDCLLEKYYLDSIEQGLRVRDKLRDGVEEALKIFGTAFLQHSLNEKLRADYVDGKLTPDKFHRQLLLLVYRLLFLMVAEERSLIISVGEHAERNQKIYDEWYSVARLRERAARIVEASPFSDLWIGLKQTFSLFEYGLDANALGIPPLNGDLFDEKRAIPDLAQAEISNHELLVAIRHLSLFKAGTTYQRVNYSALDVEELGSVYESLLDYKPVITQRAEGLVFDLRVGAERKSTGSYYTRPELVREMVESALVPVIEGRLAAEEKASVGKSKAERLEGKIKAILSLTICDPACGSGHFLLAAARRLGKELARVRTEEDEPRPEQFHLAVRDVISHCVYGVDMNPLAVDLCKLALWLEGHWAGKPLSFLDHRIRCGNSLVGVLNPELMVEGIPDDAFTAVTADDKRVAAALKKRNRQERTSRQRVLNFEPDDHTSEYATQRRQLEMMPDDNAAAVRRKAEVFSSWRAGMQHSHDEAVADLWIAQFFHPLTESNSKEVCTTKDFLEFAVDKHKKPLQVGAALAVARRNGFFHWHLEFPEVINGGGFDVVLGNPPWERIKTTEQEYFAAKQPEIAAATNASFRGKLIAKLREFPEGTGERELYDTFIVDMHGLACSALFASSSGRFPLSGRSDVNTYALFAELASQIVSENGSAGFLLPSGFVTDVKTKDLFASLFQKKLLQKFYCFDNAKGIFPAIHRDTPFGMLTLASHTAAAEFCNEVVDVEQLRDERRRYTLSWEQIQLVNPNTETAPVFRSKADAALTSSIYRRIPHLIEERVSAGNPWGISFLRMFDMATDSGRFLDRVQLREMGATRDGLKWRIPSSTSNKADKIAEFLPLLEGKMIGQFDHRAGTFEGITKRPPRGASLPEPTADQRRSPSYEAEPWYWVDRESVISALDNLSWRAEWTFGYRFGTNPTNERTLICAAIPAAATPHVFPQVIPDARLGYPLVACLFANLNAIVVDYICRQKMSRQGLDIFIVKQLPILAPRTYTELDVSFITSRVVELTYTANSMSSFARDLGYEGEPYVIETVRRATVFAELDAYYAHLYDLTRDELRYILDPKDVFGADFPSETFRVLKEHEERKFGEYRTRRLVLEAFDLLAQSDRFQADAAPRESALELVPAKKTLFAIQ